MLFQQRQECFCAFCKTPRKVYRSKYLGLISIVGLAGLSIIMAEVIWSRLDPRGLAIFGVLLMMGELFSQVKWRNSMICHNCGFDLIMYKKNPEKAAEKIKEYLVIRSEHPEFLLRPALQLPKNQKGTKISLQG